MQKLIRNERMALESIHISHKLGPVPLPVTTGTEHKPIWETSVPWKCSPLGGSSGLNVHFWSDREFSTKVKTKGFVWGGDCWWAETWSTMFGITPSWRRKEEVWKRSCIVTVSVDVFLGGNTFPVRFVVSVFVPFCSQRRAASAPSESLEVTQSLQSLQRIWSAASCHLADSVFTAGFQSFYAITQTKVSVAHYEATRMDAATRFVSLIGCSWGTQRNQSKMSI